MWDIDRRRRDTGSEIERERVADRHTNRDNVEDGTWGKWNFVVGCGRL